MELQREALSYAVIYAAALVKEAIQPTPEIVAEWLRSGFLSSLEVENIIKAYEELTSE